MLFGSRVGGPPGGGVRLFRVRKGGGGVRLSRAPGGRGEVRRVLIVPVSNFFLCFSAAPALELFDGMMDSLR